MNFFEMCIFFCNLNNLKEGNFFLTIYRYSEIIGYRHLFPLHNEPSPMPVGWKLWEEWALNWPEMSVFRRVVYITCIIKKLIITYQEPTEGIKVWILLGYPSNILRYKSKVIRKVPSFPPALPVDNFFNIHLTKKII